MNACNNMPIPGIRMNPCYSSQVLVEVSNNGIKFSGDAMFIPYSMGLDAAMIGCKSFAVPSTFAVFTVLNMAKMEASLGVVNTEFTDFD